MPDIAEPSSDARTKPDERADQQAFAQVEKWMAMIREIERERQTRHQRAD